MTTSIVYLPVRELMTKFAGDHPRGVSPDVKRRHYEPGIRAFESFLGRPATCEDLTTAIFCNFVDWLMEAYPKPKAEPKRRAIWALWRFALQQGRTPEIIEFIPFNHGGRNLYMVKTRLRTKRDPSPDQCFCKQLASLSKSEVKEALLWIDPDDYLPLIDDHEDNQPYMFHAQAVDPTHQAAFDAGTGIFAQDELSAWRKFLPWAATQGVKRAELVAIGAEAIKEWAKNRAAKKAK